MESPRPSTPQVCVVVIGYNDATHVAEAVRSALGQGAAVGEVLAVDDCSTDGSREILGRLAAEEPRLRVLARPTNSGGCGTPRNDGIDACACPYVMFLDSDDVLPPGAVDALLTAVGEHGAQVAAGLCVRRELPSGREVPWQPALYGTPSVVGHPRRRPRLVHDTLCVNKLYRTGFLREHGIRFPDGRFVYEDFVFGARLLAAGPRIALVPDPVYVWQVRRSARKLSLSLDRADIANWQARTAAHREAVRILATAGEQELARAARAKFAEHELPMYVTELDRRTPEYRAEWWRLTREYLATFDEADLGRAAAPGRVTAQVILASPPPVDLPRLKQLAARPARLVPPYARSGDGGPVWSGELPQVHLGQLLGHPVRLLPLTVDASLRTRPRVSVLGLRLYELYGRVAEAGPSTVEVELRDRSGVARGVRRTAAWRAEAGSPAPDGSWTAEVLFDLGALDPRAGVWDVRLRVRFADGTSRRTTARAVDGSGMRRTAVRDLRYGVRLVQPYATNRGDLAVRVAPGVRGVARVLRRRAHRALRVLQG
ncbi:glycosyltransferase [Streptomyces sp. KLOTTS4A1]|uniref:glycosyltransferase n=1 Tax=Streptomyces sp. KLOTTS4A1 TaxID=3390996 RepID=UPI0039F58719